MSYFDKIREQSRFAEVEINHYDDIERAFCVDAWETDDDNEEGKVVAKINLKGEIQWEDDTAKDDVFVKDTIERFFDRHYFYGKENLETDLAKRLEMMCREDRNDFEIINPDGVTSYGVEYGDILDCDCYSVGMLKNGQFKVFPIEWKKETIKEAVEWLIEDIVSAVGEEFCIEWLD